MKPTKVNVMFLLDDNGEPFAYFPDELYNRDPNVKTCYSKAKEYTACAMDYVHNCKPAPPDAFKPLLEELKTIGYSVTVKPFNKAQKQAIKAEQVKRVKHFTAWLSNQNWVNKAAVERELELPRYTLGDLDKFSPKYLECLERYFKDKGFVPVV